MACGFAFWGEHPCGAQRFLVLSSQQWVDYEEGVFGHLILCMGAGYLAVYFRREV